MEGREQLRLRARGTAEMRGRGRRVTLIGSSLRAASECLESEPPPPRGRRTLMVFVEDL